MEKFIADRLFGGRHGERERESLVAVAMMRLMAMPPGKSQQ
ncbi:MAG TPA: hypothetical protein VFP84_03850 [Kofleriaceae bacterium]|nr:hypothetical protein [Kofleriaceae bacterium]